MTDPCRKDEHTDLIRRLRDPVASSETGREAAATIEAMERSLTEADELVYYYVDIFNTRDKHKAALDAAADRHRARQARKG
jgi:hypothetical protein